MYLLDTNICIYAITERSPKVISALKSHPIGEILLSVITLAELEYGASKSAHRDNNRLMLIGFASPFRILQFDDKDAEMFGMLRAYLERAGTPIGPYDLQIAAQALARNCVLVTNNVREFKKAPGLKIENWTI
ncbi:MAG: type II toxin-antitoxin system VapC family toxin [Synergistaceae bacterium]|nr:type II toxin-antitoxin system VapC family toxin [Synergistaceae bacterium]